MDARAPQLSNMLQKEFAKKDLETEGMRIDTFMKELLNFGKWKWFLNLRKGKEGGRHEDAPSKITLHQETTRPTTAHATSSRNLQSVSDVVVGVLGSWASTNLTKQITQNDASRLY